MDVDGKPVPIGTTVDPYGRIVGILFTEGERYYLMVRNGAVSMIPRATIEDGGRQCGAEKQIGSDIWYCVLSAGHGCQHQTVRGVEWDTPTPRRARDGG